MNKRGGNSRKTEGFAFHLRQFGLRMASCGGCSGTACYDEGAGKAAGPSGDVRPCSYSRSPRNSLSGDIRMRPKTKCKKCGDKSCKGQTSYTALPHRQIKVVPYPIQPEIPPSGGDQRKKSLKQAAKDVTKAQSAKTQIPEVVINVQDIEEKQEIKVKASEPVKKIPAVKPEVPPAKSTTKPKPEPLPSVEIQGGQAIKVKSAEKVSTIAPEIIKVASPKPENKTEPSPLPAVEIKGPEECSSSQGSGTQTPCSDVDDLDDLVQQSITNAVIMISTTSATNQFKTDNTEGDEGSDDSGEEELDKLISETVMKSIMKAQSDINTGQLN